MVVGCFLSCRRLELKPAPEVWRLFVALPIPADLREGLVAAQRELRARLPPQVAAWTQADKLHLTLRFLGSVSADRVEALCGRLQAAVAGFGALPLRVERLGCFPDLRFPRVVWAGVDDAENRLPQLHRLVMDATTPFTAEPAEERFVGHVTLARTKKLRPAEAAAIGGFVRGAADRRFGVWAATAVELMRSELRSSGSQHHRLAELPL